MQRSLSYFSLCCEWVEMFKVHCLIINFFTYKCHSKWTSHRWLIFVPFLICKYKTKMHTSDIFALCWLKCWFSTDMLLIASSSKSDHSISALMLPKYIHLFSQIIKLTIKHLNRNVENNVTPLSKSQHIKYVTHTNVLN